LFAEDRASLVAHLSCMQSGHGFINDLRPTRDVTADVGQPPRDRLTAGMAPYRSPTPSPSTPPSGTLRLSKARPTATSCRSEAMGHYRGPDPGFPRGRRATDGGWVPVTGRPALMRDRESVGTAGCY